MGVNIKKMTLALSQLQVARTSSFVAYQQGSGNNAAQPTATSSTTVAISPQAYATLESDTSAPKITNHNPRNNAKNVSPKANITITFSEKIKAGAGNITLRDGSGNVVETFDVSNSGRIRISGNRIKIDPTENLEKYNQTYTVSFDSGSITDLAGNSFQSSKEYRFSTTSDVRAPKISRFAPNDNAKNVSLSSSIGLTFSEKIKAGTGYITIRDESGNLFESFDISTSSRINISGNRLKIDPTENFLYGTKYTVNIEQSAIQDLAGNEFSNDKLYDFTTKQESKLPKVEEFYPRDGNSETSTTQNLYLKFSEDIQRGSGYIILKESTGKVVERYRAQNSSNISISGNVLTIDPSVQLETNKKYKVEFAAGSVKDLAGNRYKGSKGYDFVTAANHITSPTTPSWAVINDSGGSSTGNFQIEIDYSGDPSYETYFQQAKEMWEKIIIGDLSDVGAIDDLKISATVEAIDGTGGVLGSASPQFLRGVTYLPYQGQMKFDSADMANMVANGTLLRVVMHEMGHVLGLGTLWGAPYHDFNTTVGQYTGTKGIEAYNTMSGGNSSATYVPLENDGGAGTANVHWEESIFGDELMTGYAESDPSMPLSILTIAALEDLGYEVDYSEAESYTVSA